MMKLGLFLGGVGHHIAAWRDPDVDPLADQSLAHYAAIARAAEQARFDFLFTADTSATFGPDDVAVWSRTTAASRLEPLTLLAALAATTTRLGFVSTATTTYFEPFHVARFFASLDQISGGRFAWNIVTSASPAEAYNFGREEHVPHAERYDRAEEFVEVVLGLWNTWDAGAFTADKQAGLMFDPAGLRLLRHTGRYFNVRGPLMIRRSPQGRPVLVQAGQSERGRDFAARYAEVIFTVQQDLDEAREFYADLKRRAARFGRPPESVLVMPGVLPVIGPTQAQAEDAYQRLQDLIHPELGVARLSELVGMDLTGCDLDGPLPEVPPTDAQRGRQEVVVALARRENLTIRQLYMRVTGARGHRTICGAAGQIADSLEEWVRVGAADGFNIMPLTFPAGLGDFTREVIPELQRRGLFRAEYEGTTLRQNLGLPAAD